MNTITVLLGLVSALILQAQQPNVPVALRVEALELASKVLVVIQEQPAPTVQVGVQDTVQVPTTTTQTTTQSPSSTNESVPQQTTTTPVQQTQTTGVTPPPPPTCTLSATTTMDTAYWMNTYASNPPMNRQPVQFNWSFPSDATGVLSGNGQTLAIPKSYSNGPPFDEAVPKNFSVTSHPFDATYTLTVTENGQTGTCSTEATAN